MIVAILRAISIFSVYLFTHLTNFRSFTGFSAKLNG